MSEAERILNATVAAYLLASRCVSSARAILVDRIEYLLAQIPLAADEPTRTAFARRLVTVWRTGGDVPSAEFRLAQAYLYFFLERSDQALTSSGLSADQMKKIGLLNSEVGRGESSLPR